MLFWFEKLIIIYKYFPGCSVVKNPPASAGDMGSTPGSGRSPGEENGNTPQYSCLGNPMDRGVHGITERVGQDLATQQQQYRFKEESIQYS